MTIVDPDASCRSIVNLPLSITPPRYGGGALTEIKDFDDTVSSARQKPGGSTVRSKFGGENVATMFSLEEQEFI